MPIIACDVWEHSIIHTNELKINNLLSNLRKKNRKNNHIYNFACLESGMNTQYIEKRAIS
ncbi:hypothetical protein MXB_4524 [Myxobolus squamalis]|nr:hypothetical protein MXB_4524 [Myxobolus squamalis]